MPEKLIYHSFKENLFQLTGALVSSISFLIPGIMFWKEERPIMGLFLIILGLGVSCLFVCLFLRLLTSAPYLKLTEDGFYHTAILRQRFTPWSEVKKMSYHADSEGDGGDSCTIDITLLNGKNMSIDLTLLGMSDQVRQEAYKDFHSYYRSHRPKKTPI